MNPGSKKESQDQFLIDLDLGIPHAKPVLEVREIATAFRMSEQSVRNFIDLGVFVSCAKGANGEERKHVTVERWSVEAWRLNQMEDQGVAVNQIKQSGMVILWRKQLRRGIMNGKV